MSTYAIGDVQGCFDELQELLRVIGFRRGSDRLWFVGDLVNRGPKSLAVLRFVAELGGDANVVLGNHDLNLLAIAAGTRKLRAKDTVQDILDAPDADELLEWLYRQPLLLREDGIPFTMIHAGGQEIAEIEQKGHWKLRNAPVRLKDEAAILVHSAPHGGDPLSLIGFELERRLLTAAGEQTVVDGGR